MKICLHCEKEFTHGNKKQKYCSHACALNSPKRYRPTVMPYQRILNCAYCNVKFAKTIKHSTDKKVVHCSISCANRATFNRWEEWEIIHLAFSNKGFGFSNFIRKLYPSWNSQKKQVHIVLDLFEIVKKVDGLDLHSWLQEPEDMDVVFWRDHLEEGRSLPNNAATHRASRFKSPKRRIESKFTTFKRAPEFNWGELINDKRVIE